MKDRVSEGGSARQESRKKGQGRMLSTEYINWIPSTQQGGEEVGGERVREQLPHTASCLLGGGDAVYVLSREHSSLSFLP